MITLNINDEQPIHDIFLNVLKANSVFTSVMFFSFVMIFGQFSRRHVLSNTKLQEVPIKKESWTRPSSVALVWTSHRNTYVSQILLWEFLLIQTKTPPLHEFFSCLERLFNRLIEHFLKNDRKKLQLFVFCFSCASQSVSSLFLFNPKTKGWQG